MVSTEFRSPINPRFIERRSKFSRLVILSVGNALHNAGDDGVALINIAKEHSMSAHTVNKTAQLFNDFGLAYELLGRPISTGRALKTYTASPVMPGFLGSYNAHHREIIGTMLDMDNERVDRLAMATFAAGREIDRSDSYQELAAATDIQPETVAHLSYMGFAAVHNIQRQLLQYPILEQPS